MTPNIPSLRDNELELELIEYGIQAIHGVPAYHFRMVHRETGEELGTSRLRTESTPHIERYAGHIGYAVHPQHRGHHYAAKSLRLLLPFAQQLGISPLWITCDPANIASRRTLDSIGAEFVEVVDVPADCIIHRSGHPQKCRYRIKFDRTTSSQIGDLSATRHNEKNR
jgi:predicted acetyltransferase